MTFTVLLFPREVVFTVVICELYCLVLVFCVFFFVSGRNVRIRMMAILRGKGQNKLKQTKRKHGSIIR